MSTAAALPPLPVLKSFSLTHILYDPAHHPLLSIPLTLLSLSPIFLFVSYFTLVVFTRRLTTLNLALGSIVNELLSWSLKRIWKGDRPYTGHLEIGDGYGMPSSHSQAAGFLLAWGVGYALTLDRRSGSQQTAGTKPEGTASTAVQTVRRARTGIFVFGLLLWSALTAYSRYYLLYHTPYQVVAGYIVGVIFGAIEFALTEWIPLLYPHSILGRLRRFEQWVWEGVGGIGGWDLGGSEGGWGEGHFIVPATVAGEQTKKKR